MLSLDPIISAFIGSLFGSAATLIAKYLLDQFAESNKASLGLAGKIREKYHERQADAVIKFQEKYVGVESKISEFTGAHATNGAQILLLRRHIEENLLSLDSMIVDFRIFIRANEFVFPSNLVKPINRIEELAKSITQSLSKILETDLDNLNSIDSSIGRHRLILIQAEDLRVVHSNFSMLSKEFLRGNDDALDPKLKTDLTSFRDRLAAVRKAWRESKRARHRS